MKKQNMLKWIVFLLGFMPLSLLAQSYERLWKEAEDFQQRDLPKSVIQVMDKIYAKAGDEGNIPQMMKACLVRSEFCAELAPDSVQSEKEKLKAWAERETDPVGRAVLNSLLGNITMDEREPEAEEAIRYFRLSVQDKELLAKTSAKDFRPMTVSSDLSKRFLGDTMYDLLMRQAIDRLGCRWYGKQARLFQKEALSLYDDLIAFYGERNREAALLTKLARAVYLEDGRHALDDCRLSKEEFISILQHWTEEYDGVETCADVYAKLVRAYQDKGELVKAMETARKGWKKYRRSELSAALKKQIMSIEAPSLSVSLPFIYPEKDVDLEVSYTNVTGIIMELYRMNLSPGSGVLREAHDYEMLVRQHGKKISSQTLALAGTPDYKRVDTVLHYRMPEAGIYIMKVFSKEDKKNVSYETLFVSPYQCIVLPVSEDKQEFVAVDKMSGKPVPEAEVVIYRINDDGCKIDNVYRTDRTGSVLLDKIDKRSYGYNVRTPGNDFMAVSTLGWYTAFYKQDKTKGKKESVIFTDRSLYRPGQTVYVSGVAYKQQGDSLHVRKAAEGKLKLYNGSQDVAELAVCTDEYGVFSGEFVLPYTLLPGNFYISAYESTVLIRVEEYKRPTFDVTFASYDGTYGMGDTVRVEGKAETFAGAPVRLSKVKYRVIRSPMTWRWYAPGSGEEITSGEVVSDTEGKFVMDICLKKPEVEADMSGDRPYYIYKVTAEVTDRAGETQEGVLSLPVGKQSIGLQIKGLPDKVAREKQGKIQFQALNLNRQPVKTEVTYHVYPLDSKGKWKTAVCEGRAMSQQAFILSDVWTLPSGRYMMEISAADALGRVSKAEQEFILFSLKDTSVPVKAACWFYQDGKEFDELHPADVYIGSSEEDVYLLVNIFSEEKRIKSERVTLSNEIRKYSFPYRSEYGKGIRVSFSFMRDGCLYDQAANIIYPQPEKKLMLKWETFRDELNPGSREEWRVKISDRFGNPVKANLLAAMYDASLDALQEHVWHFNLYFNRRMISIRPDIFSSGQSAYWSCVSSRISYWEDGLSFLNSSIYSHLAYHSMVDRIYQFSFSARTGTAVEAKFVPASSNSVDFEEEFISTSNETETISDSGDMPEAKVTMRDNFAETAFFYPNLRTDSLGGVSMAFTVPDALTEWKFMGFAHTVGMDYGLLTDRVKTSKPFMVQPNMPRFVRIGDQVNITASLVNLSMQRVNGMARMQLLDPITEKVVYDSSQPFAVEEGETGTVRFAFEVSSRYDVLVCKITAEAGDFSDGEQHYLPVLTNKQWITETHSVQLDNDSTVILRTTDWFNRQSPTATDRRLTVELTANPEWYVMQALPMISSPANEDALSWAVAYYANSLASTIVNSVPRIKSVFETWVLQGKEKETLMGSLEKNQDLKNIILSETPWLAEAESETEQKRRIALLFDMNAMQNSMWQAVEKLASLQLDDGSWSWYKGMSGNRYITTQIMQLLARLKAADIVLTDKADGMYRRAWEYLNKEAEATCRQMQKQEKVGGKNLFPDEQTIGFLYINALDKQVAEHVDAGRVAYLLDKLENHSSEYTIYEKSLVAVIMQANGRHDRAADLVRSIKEYTVTASGMGRYFDTPKAAASWHSYKIPTQVAAMEAIRTVSPDKRFLDEMKQWLLKQKQTQVWSTPIATADAVYAFLTDKPFVSPKEKSGEMKVVVGSVEIRTSADALGYTRKVFSGNSSTVKQIEVSKTGKGVGWGAVYVQYMEDMDKVQASEEGDLTLRCKYLSDGKPVSSGAVLRPGDKLTVRLTLSSLRDLDFVCLKDVRAACMEPVEQLSGYRQTGTLGYYRVSDDVSTSFFIDKLHKGTHVIEYEVYVTHSGVYRSGVSTAQSVYAPEIGAYTEGMVWTVGD